jgi:hypothetical protein
MISRRKVHYYNYNSPGGHHHHSGENPFSQH